MMANRDISEHFPPPTRTKGAEILRVEGVSRGARLRDVSFTLHRGEVLGVAGLLGAGRTELARVIAGADTPDSGRIIVNGKPVRVRSPRDAIRAGIGLVPEDRKRQGLVLPQSVAANLSLPQLVAARSRGRRQPRPRRADRHASGRASCGSRPPASTTRVLTLSGGNQQKVVLGKWLAARSRCPDCRRADARRSTSARKWRSTTLLDRLAAAGAGILMISSDLPEVLGMSDRILVMHRGAGRRRCSTRTEPRRKRCCSAALGLAS